MIERRKLTIVVASHGPGHSDHKIELTRSFLALTQVMAALWGDFGVLAEALVPSIHGIILRPEVRQVQSLSYTSPRRYC